MKKLWEKIVLYFKKLFRRDPYGDQVDFDKLQWTYGGENYSAAKLSTPRIEDLAIFGDQGLAYSWAISDMSDWGFNPGDIKALACFFVRGADKQWRGGKLDHISSNRLSRDFKNIFSHKYKGWGPQVLPKRSCKVAFVIVHHNGLERTNVITTTWDR